MAIESHLHELAEKHRKLDKLIAEEMTHPSGDEIKIARLKREKLRLRDLITQVRAGATVN